MHERRWGGREGDQLGVQQGERERGWKVARRGKLAEKSLEGCFPAGYFSFFGMMREGKSCGRPDSWRKVVP